MRLNFFVFLIGMGFVDLLAEVEPAMPDEFHALQSTYVVQMMFGNFRHSYLMKAAPPIPEQQAKQNRNHA